MPIRDSSFSLPVAGHRSSATQQVGQKSYMRFEAHHLEDPEQYAGLTALSPAVNAIATPSNLGNTIQQTENVFFGQTPTHPSVNPDWLQQFNEWLPTQRQVMSVQGLGDPTLCQAVWVRVFGGWLQLRQGLGDLPILPRCWNDVFNIWLQHLLESDTPQFDGFHTSIDPTLSAGNLTPLLTTPRTSDVGSSYSASPSRKIRKRTLNVVSRFTPQEIQEACRRNGVEESVIKRIGVVFPDVVSRMHLMLVTQPGHAAGDERPHQGYMEFAGRCMVNLKNVKRAKPATGAAQVQRYYCKLCGPGKDPRWKNSKDLLGHVWDTHCDPQVDGNPFLSFRICTWD